MNAHELAQLGIQVLFAPHARGLSALMLYRKPTPLLLSSAPYGQQTSAS